MAPTPRAIGGRERAILQLVKGIKDKNAAVAPIRLIFDVGRSGSARSRVASALSQVARI